MTTHVDEMRAAAHRLFDPTPKGRPRDGDLDRLVEIVHFIARRLEDTPAYYHARAKDEEHAVELLREALNGSDPDNPTRLNATLTVLEHLS